MKGKILILFLGLTFIALNSCFKEDDIVTPHDPGNVVTDVVSMTSTYKYQVYYDLGTASALRSNLKSAWDLGFSCSDSSALIILNSSKFMWAFNLGQKQITDQIDTAGIMGRFDASSGNADSNAIGQWGIQVGSKYMGKGDLYVIDRGFDDAGMPQGLMRMVFDSLVSDTFYLRFSSYAQGGVVHKAFIARDPLTNYAFFNLNGSGSVADIEPPKDTWDLHFTQYTTIYFTDLGEPYPYLVTGVLSNRYQVAAVVDSTLDFQGVDLQLAQSLILDTRLDAIGFAWKTFDFAQGTYLVRPQDVYIIRDTEGYLYKLRFISFINDTGEKGFPTFEFVKL